jgi:hypothetical protein
MKNSILKISLLAVFFLTGLTGNAQKEKITYDKETSEILVNGLAHSKMVKTRAGIVSLNYDFSIQNFDNEELIFMKFKTEKRYNRQTGQNETKVYYDITFIGTGQQVRRNGSLGERGAMKIVVKNKLIKDNNIDPSAEKRYININR